MGWFDFLFGGAAASTVEATDDRIWISQQAKLKGVRKELQERSASDSVAVLLIAHFPDVLEELNAIAAEYEGNTPVMATLAEQLSLDIASSLGLDDAAAIDLIVAERHPLLSVDDKVRLFAEELPCRCRLSHHLSLDDPLLNAFAGQQVRRILEGLGMTEDEAIESSMVSRRLKAAQQKIEAEAYGNAEAASAEDWMKKSLRDKAKP